MVSVNFRCTGQCRNGTYTGPLQDVIKHMQSNKCGHANEPLSNLLTVPFNSEGERRNLQICVHPNCDYVVNGPTGQAAHSRTMHDGERILNRSVLGTQPSQEDLNNDLRTENHVPHTHDDILNEVFEHSEGTYNPRFQYTEDLTPTINTQVTQTQISIPYMLDTNTKL